MSNIVTTEVLNEYKATSTRTIKMPDGSPKDVRMTPDLWRLFDALKVIEGITESQIAGYALEEVELQGLSFDRAYRGCVAHIANLWTP